MRRRQTDDPSRHERPLPARTHEFCTIMRNHLATWGTRLPSEIAPPGNTRRRDTRLSGLGRASIKHHRFGLLLGVQAYHSVKPLQSVPPLCQQFILNQIPGIVRKTIRPQQTKFGKPRFDFLRNAIRFVLAKAHKPLPFVASHIPVHDHELLTPSREQRHPLSTTTSVETQVIR